QGLNLLGTLYRRAEMVVEPTPAVWERRAALSFR
ncbi:alpha/beta hydrolase, partial [Aeromonas hydrophila]|nr:alpha/beta hydrolase [Aeromonas hydrophila]